MLRTVGANTMDRNLPLHETAAPPGRPRPPEYGATIVRCHSLSQWRLECMPWRVKLDFEPHASTPFNALCQLPLGMPDIVEARFSAGALIHGAEVARIVPDDALFMMIVEMGKVQVEQGGREFSLCRGDATFQRLDEPWRVRSSARFGGFGIVIPRQELDACNVRANPAGLQRLTSQCEALALLRATVRLLVQRRSHDAGDNEASAALREAARKHVFNLAALIASNCGAAGESSQNALAATRLEMALHYISAHSDDQQLTIGLVAQAQGISPRYLQRLMEGAGYSYTDVVNKTRLQKAFSSLTAASQRERTITDIAMEVGFADISYFNRLFRARFGDTPSSVRALMKT